MPTPKQYTSRTRTRFFRAFPRVAPLVSLSPLLPVSAFPGFLRLPLPTPSAEALILALYSVVIAGYYGQHGLWPRLALPGADGIEVVPCS